MLFYKRIIPKCILVSRVDAMGDVVLSLPLCGVIKKYYPGCKIIFLGRTYTKSIAKACVHVDEFMNYNDWNIPSAEISALLNSKKIDTVFHLLPNKNVLRECKKAKIKYRIGGINKIIYLLTCNILVPFSRRKSRLSEAQLNIKLLRAINIYEVPSREEVYKYYGLNKIAQLSEQNKKILDGEKFNLILHPLSNRNAREWGLDNFCALIKMLDADRYNLFITGSKSETEILQNWITENSLTVIDVSGELDTEQLIAFIAAADGLVASSTGPVHIAAAAGINTLGLYENTWTKRGERWGPIGKKAEYLECVNEDMDTITVEMVYRKISAWVSNKNLL